MSMFSVCSWFSLSGFSASELKLLPLIILSNTNAIISANKSIMPLTLRQRSIHQKNSVKKAASFKGKKSHEGEYLVTNAPTDLQSIWYPGGALTLTLLLVARLISSSYQHISDCDETYNYWEPLHYLVYGNGLQTWEYSPVYAIRSYMPLWLFAMPAKLLSYVADSATVFFTLRRMLAVFTAISELVFYKAICHEFGVHVGRLWLMLALPAAGMFASGVAMLPSSWSCSLCTLAVASWWTRRYTRAVFFTALTTLLSWPFTALIGISIAIDMLVIKREIHQFIRWSFISLVVILVPTVALDSWYYGRLVVAPWNIVAYNIFTEHGPDLYGVEPWTYYFMNGFLNFNVVWGLALICPLELFTCKSIAADSTARASFCSPYWLNLLPLYLWLIVFMIQPHKEERFLYPVYELIILAGALSLDCLQKMYYVISNEMIGWKREKRHYLSHSGAIMVIYVSFAALAGISRIAALYNNYSGPMRIFNDLPPADDTQYVCFGKDWYRSPSSFHLPDNYEIRFIPSDFKGQLPAPYANTVNATRLIHPYFNDKNKGDNTTYLRPSDCHYLVDSDLGDPTPLQPAYFKDLKTWESITTVPIIDAEKSNMFFRAFYIPFWSTKRCVYAKIYMLRNKLLSV